MSEIIVHTNYDELSRKIYELKKVAEDSQFKLITVVGILREVGKGLKEITFEYSDMKTETQIWDYYRKLRNERFVMLNVSHEWKVNYVPSLHKEANHLISPIQNAIDELTEYITALGDTLRAHIDILEMQSSRQNRRAMRKLSFMALLVAVVIPYITLWQGFARDFILNLTFPWGLSPHLNWVVLFICLVPLAWALGRAWRYLIREDAHSSVSQKTKPDIIEAKTERINLLLFLLGVLSGVIGNFFVECLLVISPLSKEEALIGYILSFAFLLICVLVIVYVSYRKPKVSQKS